MTLAIVVGVVGLLVSSALGAKGVLDLAPSKLRVDGDPDVALDAETFAAMPGCARTTAIVAGLRQSGASRGMIRHRCRVELLVTPPGGGTAVERSIEIDLGVEQLAWWLPGSVVDVAVDGPAVGVCRPLLVSTRARASGRAELPPTTVRGVPHAVYLEPAERALPPGAKRTTAMIGSIDVSSSSTGTRCAVTLGLWVGGEYATTISDRFRLDELTALARGANVAVVVDPTDPLKVAVDVDSAVADLAARLPDAAAMRHAVVELGLPGQVAMVRSVASGRGKMGVRYQYTATVVPLGRDGATGSPLTVHLMLAVPDAAPIVEGAAVVLDAEGRMIDIDATAAARVDCALSRH